MQNAAPDLGRRAAEANAKFLVALAVIVFLAAGTLAYWQGWLFLINFAAWSVGLVSMNSKPPVVLVSVATAVQEVRLDEVCNV